MSVSPYFYVEKYNQEKKQWEYINLYNSKMKEIDFWPWNGSHEIFNMIKKYGKTNIILDDLSPEVKEKYLETGYYDFSFDGNGKKYISYYVLPLFILDQIYFKNPKVVDDEAKEEAWAKSDLKYEELDDKDFLKENPIKSLIDRIETWIELSEDYFLFSDEERIKHGDEIRLVAWIMS